MKFGVVIFPGSNCDEDIIYTLGDILGQEVTKLWHKDHDLQGCDFIVVPGGFSYGDYLRSGAIARFSPIMNEVVNHANRGGYVLGICNGFQILTEARLLPGALLHNTTRKFMCKNVHLQPVSASNAMTKGLDKKLSFKIPIAHGEGNYYIGQEELKRLEDQDQVLFRYCNASGEVNEMANPNGSLNNIAGVCNERKNVMGMMPHPERAADFELGNEDGRTILENLIQNLG
jgi:phosphoribosylformylglycinamidine synthase I